MIISVGGAATRTPTVRRGGRHPIFADAVASFPLRPEDELFTLLIMNEVPGGARAAAPHHQAGGLAGQGRRATGRQPAGSPAAASAPCARPEPTPPPRSSATQPSPAAPRSTPRRHAQHSLCWTGGVR